MTEKQFKELEKLPNINDISTNDVIYDLERHLYHAKDVYFGNLKGTGLSKEGAFRRMQVYIHAINKLK